MILIVGTFRIPVDQLEAARPAMERVIAATRGEDGCVSYAYANDILDPGLIRVSEEWRDEAALTAHFKAPHMRAWVEERTSFGLSDRNIVRYRADDGEQV